jgi:hypothetical protein
LVTPEKKNIIKKRILVGLTRIINPPIKPSSIEYLGNGLSCQINTLHKNTDDKKKEYVCDIGAASRT